MTAVQDEPSAEPGADPFASRRAARLSPLDALRDPSPVGGCPDGASITPPAAPPVRQLNLSPPCPSPKPVAGLRLRSDRGSA